VAPDTPLLYLLRNEIGLNNPHFGCGLAQCGACTGHGNEYAVALRPADCPEWGKPSGVLSATVMRVVLME
jgi:hypothetical protein